MDYIVARFINDRLTAQPSEDTSNSMPAGGDDMAGSTMPPSGNWLGLQRVMPHTLTSDSASRVRRHPREIMHVLKLSRKPTGTGVPSPCTAPSSRGRPAPNQQCRNRRRSSCRPEGPLGRPPRFAGRGPVGGETSKPGPTRGGCAGHTRAQNGPAWGAWPPQAPLHPLCSNEVPMTWRPTRPPPRGRLRNM